MKREPVAPVEINVRVPKKVAKAAVKIEYDDEALPVVDSGLNSRLALEQEIERQFGGGMVSSKERPESSDDVPMKSEAPV